MKSYCSSFAVSKSLLALVLSRQGFISINFEWTFLHLKSIIDQITQYTFKNAKFEAFIAAMHWHRSKSTFLLEQFLNSERGKDQEQISGWGHLLRSRLMLSHNRSPHSGSFHSWVWLDFKKNLKQLGPGRPSAGLVDRIGGSSGGYTLGVSGNENASGEMTWGPKWPVSKNITSLTLGPKWPASKNVRHWRWPQMTCQQKRYATDTASQMTF